LRTALAYLTSLICHGIVLVPLAHLAVSYETRPPTYSTYCGSGVLLKASQGASENDVDGQELQVVIETSS